MNSIEQHRQAPLQPQPELRAHPRAELHTEVNFAEHTNFYTGFTGNISEGGLFVATYDLLEPGKRVNLVFELPTGHEVRVTGEVRWVRDPMNAMESDVPPGLGLQFLDLTDADKKAIEEFTRRRAPMFYD